MKQIHTENTIVSQFKIKHSIRLVEILIWININYYITDANKSPDSIIKHNINEPRKQYK